MPTPFEKLEAEVRNLRREIRRLKGNPADELTGAGDEKSDRQGGLHTGSTGTGVSIHPPSQ